MNDTATSATGMGLQPVAIQNLFNAFEQEHAITLTYTASGAAAAENDVYVLAGVGDSAAKSLPANVTLSGDFGASNDDLQEMMRNQGIVVTGIELQTDVVATNWNKEIVFANRTPNKQNITEKRLSLTRFREIVGNTYSDTIIIPEAHAFAVLPQTYMKLKIVQSSYIRVKLYYRAVQMAGSFISLGTKNPLNIFTGQPQ